MSEAALPPKAVLEAALLTSEEPLEPGELARMFEPRMARNTVAMLLDEIKTDWSPRPLELVEVAGGWRFQARREYVPYLARLNPGKEPTYPRSVVETLAIIAYKQPITRAEVDEIRGVLVNSGVLRILLERKWITVVGHKDLPGRPILYGTTQKFLDDLNLRSLVDLPMLELPSGTNLLLPLEE